MTEEAKRLWDVCIASLGWIATVFTIFVGISQFNRGELNKIKLENELLIKKDEIAFQRQFWLERLATYRKIAEVAGAVIANVSDKKKWKKVFYSLRACIGEQ